MNEKWVTKSVVVVVYGREEMKTVVLREGRWRSIFGGLTDSLVEALLT
jgi:hypothetical protein